MTDLFWDVATSYPVLGLIGAVFVAALVVGYFPLLKWFPMIGQYVPAARLVVLIAAGLLCFLIGFRVSDGREEAKRLSDSLKFKQLELDTQKETAATAERLRKAAEANADNLAKKVQTYEDELAKKPPGGGALDDGDVRSLRGIAN